MNELLNVIISSPYPKSNSLSEYNIMIISRLRNSVLFLLVFKTMQNLILFIYFNTIEYKLYPQYNMPWTPVKATSEIPPSYF